MLLPVSIYAALLLLIGALSVIFYRIRVTPSAAGILNAAASLLLLVVVITGYKNSGTALFSTGWSMPLAEFSIGTDFLSQFFIIPLLILSAACSVYGIRYFKKSGPKKGHCFFYSLLTAGMVMVLISRNAVLFMISWEVMSFSSFLLVITEAQKETVRRAGWIYFITAHIGTAFLLAVFFLLGSGSASLSFEHFGKVTYSVPVSNLIFIFSLIGFGLKAGFIPFHIWLPLAHPAAPSHVSALMSGIMIKMGLYGILRVLTIIAPFRLWWGVLLIITGAVTGILGILYAGGQHDMKRLLAYSSVENVGIILIGLGIGITGRVSGYPLVSTFGFAGALLHIINHALFKGLLFLGAGSVIRQTGTGEIDRLGGLMKKMPVTGALFLTGAAAITGLPFLNGFISEFLIYAAAVLGAVSSHGSVVPLFSALALLSLALIGGLAAVCFTKVFGAVFLGESRSVEISDVSEVPAVMNAGMLFLAVIIIFIGTAGFAAVPFLVQPVLLLSGGTAADCTGLLSGVTLRLSIILSVVLAAGLLIFAAGRFFRQKTVKGVDTWGCGYANSSSRMQYTGSSYTAPVTDRFKLVIAEKREINSDTEIFPAKPWSFRSEARDWVLALSGKAVKFVDRILSLLRWFQCGKAGVYVLYIGITVIILLVWKFAI